MKKSFILYTDQAELVDSLTDVQAGKLIKAIYKFSRGEEIKLDQLTKTAFLSFKQTLVRDLEKWEKVRERNIVNGKMGGRPRLNKTQNNPEKPKKPSGYFGNPKNLVSVSVSDINNTSGVVNEISLVQEVWNHYIQTSGTKELLLPARKHLISNRLAKFTAADLKLAVTNCFANKFYSGDNDKHWRADASYVFRSDEIVDRLLNLKNPEEKKTWRNAPYD